MHSLLICFHTVTEFCHDETVSTYFWKIIQSQGTNILHFSLNPRAFSTIKYIFSQKIETPGHTFYLFFVAQNSNKYYCQYINSKTGNNTGSTAEFY